MTQNTSHTGDSSSVPTLKQGVGCIKAALKTMPQRPGVYRMLNESGDVLYVGKAKNLKQRVTNYTQTSGLSWRITRMVAATRRMEITVTESEAQALLLEANQIKKLQPRYNILLRDDKSFPFILITKDHAFPRITKYRGPQKKGGEYYGPFASAGAVNQTIATLQRAFLLRPCTDNIFKNRTRPCLQYQIKRCSAPCVEYINPQEYAALLEQARTFLSGKSREIQDAL
ncbi:MAG: GIY-YIG nuclease family protein, partial [Sinomicrobium sp.]|nr:GIY-YIG nuclease family protein [Sinomicrobium sp.]